MSRSFLFLLTFVCSVNVVSGQVRQFPYEARVVVPQAYVRSGGGEGFYPTSQLPKGAVVNVHRHDPGGWYMIDPPAESFSWIPEKFVRRLSVEEGEILETDAVVFVGSAFGDETSVWQRKMMAGEKVVIKGERQVDTLSGPKAMLKISPPAREYRWIQGTAIVPVGDAVRLQHDRNPYAVPSNVVMQNSTGVDDTPSPGKAGPAPPTPSAYSPTQHLTRLMEIRDEQRQLQEIDQRFRKTVLSDPSSWDLQAIEQAYRELQNRARHKPVAAQIDLRYPAIEQYRQKKAKLDDFQRLTSETERRDSELLASQFNRVPQSTTFLPVPPGFEGFSESMLSSANPVGPVISPGGSIESVSFSNTLPGNPQQQAATNAIHILGNPQTRPESSVPPSSRFIGAGIIQRTPPGGKSEFVLTSPAGKMLAALTASGSTSLNEFVGRPVGLQGKRWFDAETSADVIEVSGIETVRLRQ